MRITLSRYDAALGQWLLRLLERDSRRHQRNRIEYRQLPHRIRDIPVWLRRQLGQCHQCQLHRLAVRERRMQRDRLLNGRKAHPF